MSGWEMTALERESALNTRSHLHFVASDTPWRCIAALPWCFAPALWQAWWKSRGTRP